MPARAWTITVLYDNRSSNPDLIPAHGLSCLVENEEETLLFDTGSDGTLLLENMARLGKDPMAVRKVVISHMHWDHAGGLFHFLRCNPGVEVFFPVASSKYFREHAAKLGARVHTVDGPREIAPGLRSTGTIDLPELPRDRKEQALVFHTREGAVLLTGCAHPGIVLLAEKAVALEGPRLAAVLGGFHLVDAAADEIDTVIADLRRLGARRIGAGHCTGDGAIAALNAAWGAEAIPFHCGATIPLPARE